MPRQVSLRAFAVALTLFTTLSPSAPAAAAATTPTPPYRPPVDAPLVDVFRPPSTPYGPGNRGVDYATTPGTPVLAASDGTVTFAGHVGGSLHVTVLHDDGVRTTLSFLATTTVRRGQRVRQGDKVGTAAASLHFGARVGDDYIDPLALLSRTRPRARLVPDDGKGLPSEAAERSAIQRLLSGLRTAGKATAQTLTWAAGKTVARLIDPDLLKLAPLLGSGSPRLAAAVGLLAWAQTRGGCTTASTPAPPPLKSRRIAVLVGGLGSSSGHAAVLDVDTAALGYNRRAQFSYRGGTTEESSYGPADTERALAASGAQLRLLLARLAAEHPDTTIDVIAHSQGGLVAREALQEPFPAVGHLVTLGTPHQGAPLAGVVAGLRTPLAGAAFPAGLLGVRVAGLDPGGPSPSRLRPNSPSIRARPADGTRATSISARTDWVVPAGRSWLPGAANVTVSAPGVTAHDALPGSKQAHREIALAVNDMPPTCSGVMDAAADAAVSMAIEGVSMGASFPSPTLSATA